MTSTKTITADAIVTVDVYATVEVFIDVHLVVDVDLVGFYKSTNKQNMQIHNVGAGGACED
jgi:hypothetical protein